MRILIALVLAFLPRQDDLKKQAAEMKKVVTKVRGVEFKKDVTVGVYSKDELLKFIQGEFEREFPRPKAKKYEKAYAHFGLIPADMDLYDSLIVLFSDSIAGFYHPKTKELKLVASEATDEESKLMEKVTLIHELAHAAQDQNFDLVTVPMEEEYNDDMIAGIKALIEGEASAVGWMGGLEEAFDDMIKMINDSYKTGDLPGAAGKLPAYLRLTLTFSYGYGCDFVLAVKKAKGDDWSAITKMYEDLPSSTEQVLHPEKYWDKRDNPTIITLPALPDEWKLLANNVHGEFVVKILLRELKAGEAKECEKAAAGWDGDRFHVVERGGKVSSVWYSTWDSEGDAKEFEAAYRKALATKHKGDETAAMIERKGADVLVIDGEEDLQKHAPTIWEKTKKEELKKVERFKPGRWTCGKHPKVEKDLNTYCPECGERLTKQKEK